MNEPLAYKLRPEKLDEVIGQEHLVGKDKILRRLVDNKRLFSIIFFGPPGTGKTTLARCLANELNVPYRLFNAVTGNKKDLDAIFTEAKLAPGLIVICDEVHRLNKDKQDLLLPYVEDGSIILLGATTSNPLFAINPAIRSRCQLLEVKSLTSDDLIKAINNACVSPKGFDSKVTIDDDAAKIIAEHANGDVRYALNILEICALDSSGHITKDTVLKYSSFPNMGMDHDDDNHYDAVSAFQKSIRGSDVNASLYYLARLIATGDMDSIERRLLVIAYEDIGLANPAAVARTINAIDAAKRVGFPEGSIPLGVAVCDLALSPKSKSGCLAIHAAEDEVSKRALNVPDYLRLTPVNLDKDMQYDYEHKELWPLIQYLPDAIKDIKFYEPNTNSSYEAQLAKNYEQLEKNKRSNNISNLKKKVLK